HLRRPVLCCLDPELEKPLPEEYHAIRSYNHRSLWRQPVPSRHSRALILTARLRQAYSSVRSPCSLRAAEEWPEQIRQISRTRRVFSLSPRLLSNPFHDIAPRRWSFSARLYPRSSRLRRDWKFSWTKVIKNALRSPQYEIYSLVFAEPLGNERTRF